MELYHHGILGQKWGERNGPPYPLKGRQYSSAELAKKYKTKRRQEDHVIEKGKVMNTLARDPNRTKNVEMFYAAHTKDDKNFYMSIFNYKVPSDEYDLETGEKIGTANCYKYMINNKAATDIKVAGDEQSAKLFANLYKKDRDFSNFVTDKNRMQKYFEEAHANKPRMFYTKEYKDTFKALDKLDDPSKLDTNDMRRLYAIFNYTLAYDGTYAKSPDPKGGKDVATQRAKFFRDAKKEGYGAILDSNDTFNGSFKADKPVIVFDMEQVVPDKIWQTSFKDKAVADLVNTVSMRTLRQALK